MDLALFNNNLKQHLVVNSLIIAGQCQRIDNSHLLIICNSKISFLDTIYIDLIKLPIESMLITYLLNVMRPVHK